MIKLKSSYILTLEATSGAAADGSSVNTITATLMNGSTPVSGENIDLSATSVNAAFSPTGLSHTTVTTDSSGVATAALTDTVEESVTVKGTLLSDTSVTAQAIATFGNIWSSFYRLDTLKIDFRDNSSSSSATIFGNGNNQVAVLVHVKILGPDASTVLSIPEEELKQQISLINYGTGDKLNYNGNSPDSNKPWVYSDTDKGFADAYQYSSSSSATDDLDDSDISIITYYVSADDLASGLDIGVSFSVPGVGEFNTTSNGTSTKNGPEGKTGSVFKSPSFVHLSALSRIDYTDVTNLYVNGMPSSYDDFEIISDEMLIDSYIGAPPPDGDLIGNLHAGKGSKKTITIRPAESALSFKNIDVDRKYLQIPNANIVGINNSTDMIWRFSYKDDNPDASGTHSQLFFLNQESYGVSDGLITTYDSEFRQWDVYVIDENSPSHHFTQTLIKGSLTINVLDLFQPYNSTSGYNWDSAGAPLVVNLTDYYGNDGVITIKTVDEKWPKILINDQ